MVLRITRHPFCKLSMLYPFVPSFLFASFLLLDSSTFISSLCKTPFLRLPRIDIESFSISIFLCFDSRLVNSFYFSSSSCLSSFFISNFFIHDLFHLSFLSYFARFFFGISGFFARFFQLSFTCLFIFLPLLSCTHRSLFPFPGSIMALKRSERPLGFNLLTGKRQKKYHSYSSSKTDRGCLARSIKRLPCLRQLSGLIGCALNESILDSWKIFSFHTRCCTIIRF